MNSTRAGDPNNGRPQQSNAAYWNDLYRRAKGKDAALESLARRQWLKALREEAKP